MSKVYLSAILLLFTTSVFAQSTDEEAIEAVVTTLFDGMRAGDSTMVASTFLNDAVMQTVQLNREGEVVRSVGSLSGFKNAVGTPHPDVWDEQITSVDIRIDGNLASVWTPYKFFVGDQFSHCGVNSFQMVKLNNEWKITYIIDTRRRDNCVE